MKALVFTLLLAAPPAGLWLTRVRAHNEAQAQAQAAVARHQPAEAAYYYQQAIALSGRGGPGPALLLNLAQAQAQAGQDAAARATYGRLLGSAVPETIGSTARQQLAVLLARQQQVAQASSLLRQALQLNPANATARYNYEVLSRYLAGQQPDSPPPPPAAGPGPGAQPTPKSAPAPSGKDPQKSPAPKAGDDHPGQAPDPAQPAGGDTQAPRPSASGQPDAQRPTPNAGSSASGGFQPGAGEQRPLPSGQAPGSQRGLDAGATTGPAATGGHGRQPGTEAATNADLQLQTQRERLKAMNLSPAQARQLLESLRESEQQYLQQRPQARPSAALPPGTPTW